MAKTRFSISVDPEDAATIKAAAARAGQDVSAYMARAALAAAERDDRAARIFAGIDARIADAEGRAAAISPPPAGTNLDADLDDAQRSAIAARWEAFFAATERGAA